MIFAYIIIVADGGFVCKRGNFVCNELLLVSLGFVEGEHIGSSLQYYVDLI